MNNDLYVDRNVADRMQYFTQAEKAGFLDRLEIIRMEPLENSAPVPHAPDLRIAEVAGHSIVFTYRPADRIVMVTGLDDLPFAQQAYSQEAVPA